MRVLTLAFALLAAAGPLWAQAELPLEFRADPGWQALPSYLGNAAARPAVRAVDGAVELRVDEPGKGMKFRLPLKAFDYGSGDYLLLRYRAANLGTGYALWAEHAGGPGRELVRTTDLKADGQWHVLALDLPALGETGSIHGILTEVQCAREPAWIAFASLAPADEAPAGADLFPRERPKEQEFVARAGTLPLPERRPGWLANASPRAEARVEEGILHLRAEGAGAGMKWSTPLRDWPDLSPFRFLTVRYRARGVARPGDYFLWVGSQAGGMPLKQAPLVGLPEVVDDGDWHSVVYPLNAPFQPVEMAFQVQSRGAGAEAWIDTLRFTTTRPLLRVADVLPLENGHAGARLLAGAARLVDLAPLANATAGRRLRPFGLAEWPAGAKVTVRGIPFLLPRGERNVLLSPRDIAQMATVPLQGTASEVYLFLAAKLPALDLARVGDGVPMRRFDNPERFVARVVYADGVTDELFPIRVGAGRFEVVAGIDVYCLNGLRRAPLRSLSLCNRMESASFLLGGVTLNAGKALTPRPAVAALPPAVGGATAEGAPAWWVLRAPGAAGAAGALQARQTGRKGQTGPTSPTGPAAAAPRGPGSGPRAAQPAPRIARRPGGFLVESATLSLDLQTAGGIALRAAENRCLRGGRMRIQPGPLFSLGVAGRLVPSTQIATGEPTVETGGTANARAAGRSKIENRKSKIRIPVDATAAGVPLKGEFTCTVDGAEVRMELHLTVAGDQAVRPVVHFPLVSGVALGSPEDTWYLWCRKGGWVNRVACSDRRHYGGEYPLQVADFFNPALGGGLSLATYDLKNLYKTWCLEKSDAGGSWRIEYEPREYLPGEAVAVAPAALRAHTGDWRAALAEYRRWVGTWYRPAAARKPWFQGCFNYRQHWAWGDLRDPTTGRWRIPEVIAADRAFFGCLDYLHIFDFGESRVFGRVGDYNHYDELGGLKGMADAIAGARKLGVPVGLYIEGYLCDKRSVWGKENVARFGIRRANGALQPYGSEDSPEFMMCPAAAGWRDHLAQTYRRVAGELRPSGMYIDQFGFLDPWKTCHARDHGHPVPPCRRPPTAARKPLCAPSVPLCRRTWPPSPRRRPATSTHSSTTAPSATRSPGRTPRWRPTGWTCSASPSRTSRCSSWSPTTASPRGAGTC